MCLHWEERIDGNYMVATLGYCDFSFINTLNSRSFIRVISVMIVHSNRTRIRP